MHDMIYGAIYKMKAAKFIWLHKHLTAPLELYYPNPKLHHYK